MSDRVAFQDDFLGELDNDCDFVEMEEVAGPREWLDAFFSGVNVRGNEVCKRLSWAAGGPIPQRLIHTQKNYNLLNNVPLAIAIDIGYESIAKMEASGRHLSKCGDDISAALSVIRRCEMLEIPQEHIGGIFLLYLELCERVELL